MTPDTDMHPQLYLPTIGALIIFLGISSLIFPGITHPPAPLGDVSQATILETVDTPSSQEEKNAPSLPYPMAGLEAHAAGIYDPIAGTFLIEKNIDTELGIASLTKIMAALIASEYLADEDNVAISEEAIRLEGNTGDMYYGEEFVAHDLVSLMLVASSNDAAAALAETVGRKIGGKSFLQAQEIFIRLMNERVRALGMDRTAFQNPTGLDIKDALVTNTSTVRNLAKLIAYTLTRRSNIWQGTESTEAAIASKSGRIHRLENSNALIGELSGLIGSKTGYTDAAGGSLVVVSEIPLGKPKIFIVLGSTYDGRFSDMRMLTEWMKGASN